MFEQELEQELVRAKTRLIGGLGPSEIKRLVRLDW